MKPETRAFFVGLILALMPLFTAGGKVLAGGADWKLELGGLCLTLPAGIVLWLMRPPRVREDGSIDAEPPSTGGAR